MRDAVEHILARIDAACRIAKRDPALVHLIAVSKYHPAQAIRAAYAAGQRDFGESYAQELAEKAEALADLPELRWHFIGPVQRNKAKIIARYARTVHAIESARAAAALDAAGSPLELFVQVNVSGEASKHGITPAALPEILAELSLLSNVRAVGLMTLPPPDLGAADAAFAALAELASAHGLPCLSMGMSDDLELAIAHGATHVRVGTAIFGERRG